MSALDDLRSRLEQISEELAELTIERLRDDLAGDEPRTAIDDRRLARARRAVDKAAALLVEHPDEG